ncbi:MAG: hypothetical protein QNK36_11820 [Colwellia sp.]|nr:hypothetical protein [Colwellia sp.]
MNNLLPLDADKKLAVTYRVEAGCLGSDGLNYISDFCKFAQSELQTSDSGYIAWNIIHRADKTLPEIQYGLVGKTINSHKAEKYLSAFGNTIDNFEEQLTDHLATLISEFMSTYEGSGHYKAST